MSSEKCYLGHINCMLSFKQLDFLAQHTVTEWKRIALLLHVEENVIEDIDSSDKNSAAKAFQGYKKWHQKYPNKACNCVLFEVLKCVDRNDVVEKLKLEFKLKDSALSQSCHYQLTSVCYFVGREEELNVIKEFFKKEQQQEQLLIMLGLPGIGKTEIINEALNNIDRNRIVRVNFLTRENIKKWSFDDVAQCILKKWKSVIDHDLSGDIDLFDVLGKKNEGVILILEFAHLHFEEFVFPRFYNSLHPLLRSKASQLKILTTCCQLPDSIHTKEIDAKIIYVRDLNKDNSVKLLNGINPQLSEQTCEDIFNRCGGSPLMLRKIGAETKQFFESQKKIQEFIHQIESPLQQDYLSPLIRRTVWLNDMTNVFDALNNIEKNILVRLSVFHKVIPRWSLCDIFKDAVPIFEVDHLCEIHCILDKVNSGTCYQISELYKTFIWEYTSQEKNEALKKLQDEARLKVTKYFLNFLDMLTKQFFSKSTEKRYGIFDNFIMDHKEICRRARNNACQCCNFVIAKETFNKYKYMFLKSLYEGIRCSSCAKLTVEVLSRSVQFLRHALSHVELVELCNTVWKEAKSLNPCQQAVILANMVFIKFHKGCVKELAEYKKILDISIHTLSNSCIPLAYEECLTSCLLKRAYLVGVYSVQDVEKDLKTAQEKLKKKSKIQISKFSIHGVKADILSSNGNYEDALALRKKQLVVYKEHLGDHSLTATSIMMYGKCLEKLAQDPVKHYKASLDMYNRLRLSGKETAKTMMYLGKIYCKQGKADDASQCFRSAQYIVEQLFEEQKKIKSPYLHSSAMLLLSIKQCMQTCDAEIKTFTMEVKSIRQSFKKPKKYSLTKHNSHQRSNISEEFSIHDQYSSSHIVIMIFLLLSCLWLFCNY